MRASLLVPCALVLALGGCRGSSRETPAPAEKAEAPAPSASALEEAGAAAASDSSSADGIGDPPPLRIQGDTPSMRYAQLGREACLAELGRRAIPFEEAPPSSWAQRSRSKTARAAAPASKTTKRATPAKRPKPTKKTGPHKRAGAARSARPPEDLLEAARQIMAPVRLRGPLHGIAIHSALPEKVRATASFEVFDCRLVLALDDFTSLLAEHDVVEVIHMSAFRSPRDRGCTPKYPGKQHCGALALDVGVFKKKDGSTLDVDRDWNGRIGMQTCTPGTGPSPETPAAKELWDIVCESAQRGLFHVVLTPNYNAEHKNHLHLEVTPGVSWMLIH